MKQVSLDKRVIVPTPGIEILCTRTTGAAFEDWWDPAGEGLCVVAAYRAINTPGNPWPNDQPTAYLDTLVNNANPGTYDLTEGNGGLPWNVLFGWQALGPIAAQYFLTGIVPAQNWSLLCQFSGVPFTGASQCAVGEITNGAALALFPRTLIGGAGQHRYYDGASIDVAPGQTTANMGVAANQGYLDGVPDGGPIPVWTLPNVNDIYLLAYILVLSVVL